LSPEPHGQSAFRLILGFADDDATAGGLVCGLMLVELGIEGIRGFVGAREILGLMLGFADAALAALDRFISANSRGYNSAKHFEQRFRVCGFP
jgi:hypothetical protein